MNKKIISYVSLLTVIGASVLVYSIYSVSSAQIPLIPLFFFILVSAICESLVVFTSEDKGVNVTYALVLAAQLAYGTGFAVIVATCGTLFAIVRTPKGKVVHLLNQAPIKTAYNASSYAITTFAAGYAYSIFLNTVSFNTLSMQQLVFLPIYIVAYFLFNSIFMAILISLQMNESVKTVWVKNTLWTLPNFLGIAPLGVLINALYDKGTDGYWYILILLLPLFLARYSFKLYLDYKNQYFKTVQVLSAAIEAKDPYTEGHSRRVEYYAEAIARRMGLSQSKIEGIKVAALLHDIGKIGIEDAILRKPGSLSASEWDRMHKHPELGVHILEDIAFPYNVKDVIRHHHERYDGTGYPDGRKGDETSMEAYILCAADAYDAMSSDRPYRSALDRERIMTIFKAEAGGQFEPHVAAVVYEMLERNMLTYPGDNPL